MAPILVAVLVTASVAKANGGLGKRFGTVIGLYISSTLIASLVAVLASRLFPVTLTLTGVDAGGEMAPAALSEVIGNLLLGLISTPLSAVRNAAYQSVLFWSIVMGLALKNTRSQQAIQVIRQ